MDASIVSAIIAGVGVIMSAWLGFAGNKKGTLASAEKDFRQTILEENKKMRHRIEQMETKISELTLENHELKLEIIGLKAGSPTGGQEDERED